MESHSVKPKHASFRRHRRQVASQIVLPMVVTGLIFIGTIILIWWGTFRANGDVSRWAAISTIWLTLPILFAALVLLVVLVGLVYLVGLVAGYIPRYTYPVQNFVLEVAAVSRRIDQFGHNPWMLARELGGLMGKGAARAFETLRDRIGR